jgi:hypothetical protein
VKFGKKAGTITSQSSSGNVDWPKALKKGETRVRFVFEIADWQEYWEHYDETVKFFPCTGDKATCPGCTSNIERTAKASKRYLAPVLDPKTGRVWGLKMGQDLANRMSLRNDRNGGTVTNRDYTLIRSGEGLDTEYDVEQEEKVAIDLSAYEDALDLDEMLAMQFAGAWPDFDPDNPPVNGRTSATTRRRRDDDEPAAAAPRKRAARKTKTEEPDEAQASQGPGMMEQLKASADAAKEQRAAEGSADDPPSDASSADDTAEAGEADGEVVELTEDDLRNMSRTELIQLAKQAEVPVTLTMNRDQIIDLFLEQFSG